jgi:hypothetical protein
MSWRNLLVEYYLRMRNLDLWVAMIVLSGVQGLTTIYLFSNTGAPMEAVMAVERVYTTLFWLFIAVPFGKPALEMAGERAWKRWDLPTMEVIR